MNLLLADGTSSLLVTSCCSALASLKWAFADFVSRIQCNPDSEATFRWKLAGEYGAASTRMATTPCYRFLAKERSHLWTNSKLPWVKIHFWRGQPLEDLNLWDRSLKDFEHSFARSSRGWDAWTWIADTFGQQQGQQLKWCVDRSTWMLPVKICTNFGQLWVSGLWLGTWEGWIWAVNHIPCSARSPSMCRFQKVPQRSHLAMRIGTGGRSCSFLRQSALIWAAWPEDRGLWPVMRSTGQSSDADPSKMLASTPEDLPSPAKSAAALPFGLPWRAPEEPASLPRS